jgi:hypothetical protein
MSPHTQSVAVATLSNNKCLAPLRHGRLLVS